MIPLYSDEEINVTITSESNDVLEIIIGLIDDYFKGYLDLDLLTVLIVNL